MADNTPNAPKFISPSPKVRDFDEKRLHWASVVCVLLNVYFGEVYGNEKMVVLIFSWSQPHEKRQNIEK